MPRRLSQSTSFLLVLAIMVAMQTLVEGLVRPPPSSGRRFAIRSNSDGNSINSVDSSSSSNEVDNDGNVNSDDSGGSSNTNVWFKLSQETRDDIKSTAVSFGIALLVRAFLIEPRYIPSLSMFPTFDIGDQLLVDKISHLQRGIKLTQPNPTQPTLT